MSRRPIMEWLVPSLRERDASDEANQRLRKFLTLALVILVACLGSVLLQLTQGAFRSAAGTSVVLVSSACAVLALRFRVGLGLVTTGYLGVGVVVAALMGMTSGSEGLTSIFWILAAPLVAMAVGGRKAGYATLALSVAAIALGLYGIEAQWLAPVLIKERTFGTKLVSMLGVVVTVFFLVRAYESETQASIRRLKAQNRQLDEARADAERANTAKSTFLATISHEIRTPLNGVTGIAALLADERDPQRVKEGLVMMQQSADTLLAVINDVLDFSKIESNHLQLEAIPFSPRAELQLVVNLTQARAAENRTDVELIVAPAVPAWLTGDPTRFRQVALNLVANAVKFAPGGLVSCTLDLSDGALLLEVIDNGIGMSPEVVSKLFTPFSQADTSTTRRFGGTGLGLVIAHRLVAAMQGTIEVESSEGVGSCFIVRAPCVECEAPPLHVAPVAGAVCRVLVVEDNPVNQLVVTRLLERMGHEVTMASDGQRALEVCQSKTFDVVLMDCHMPVMDGFAAAKALRARGVTTPIYALTAAVSTEDRERCLAAGMNELLAKPLHLERLREVLASVKPGGVDRSAA
ncbi:MAG: ATP-binding protein [Myxococcales bacterium]|nr:ATP-binding protein [Myxococcales bacterium]